MKLHTAALAGGALLLAAGGAAMAAGKLKTVSVDLENGTVAQIEYAGEVAPRVTLVPVQARTAPDPFAEMDRMFAQMEAQRARMLQQVAEMQHRAAASGDQLSPGPGQVVVSTDMPAGSTYHYTVVSSTSGKGGICTQTVEYSSDGKSSEPKVTRASSGDCAAVKTSEVPIPAAAPAPAPAQPAAPPRAPRDPNMI